MNPYRLPEDEHCVLNISGGRSSGFMLHETLDAHGGTLPDNVTTVFTNTGKENPETLDFVKEMGERWDVDFHWLEYRYLPDAGGHRYDPRHVAVRVDYDTASRNSEPFEQMIRAASYLPNPVTRKCTVELKKMTTVRYMKRDMGIKMWHPVIGYRHDEPKRWGKSLYKECAKEEGLSFFFPMVQAKITRPQVRAFWHGNDFDLQLEDDKDTNCDLCFLKGEDKKIAIIRQKPAKVEWWISMEEFHRGNTEYLRKPAIGQFRQEYSYQDLKNWAAQDMFPESSEDEWAGCFCTD